MYTYLAKKLHKLHFLFNSFDDLIVEPLHNSLVPSNSTLAFTVSKVPLHTH